MRIEWKWNSTIVTVKNGNTRNSIVVFVLNESARNSIVVFVLNGSGIVLLYLY